MGSTDEKHLFAESLISKCFVQVKYKASGKQQASDSLYATLPETLDTQHAKHATALISEVQRPCVQTLWDSRTRSRSSCFICSGEVQRGRQTELVQPVILSTARDASDANGQRDRRRAEPGELIYTR